MGHEVYGAIIEEDEEDEEYENTAIEGAENVLAATIIFEYSTSIFYYVGKIHMDITPTEQDVKNT